MVRISKIISWIVLVCFLFNTAGYDLASGQTLSYHPSQDKLAAPSELTDIIGIQHKDMGRIKLALEERLMFLWTNNVPSFIPILMDEKINFKEKTIFQPADMQFFFHEIKLTNAGPCVMVRLKDKYGLRTYYAAFSLRKDENGGFPINIYTEEQYKNTAAFTKGVPRTKTEDTEAITRYVENNEKIIDTFIRERIEAGDFAEVKSITEDLDLDRKFPDRKIPKSYFGNFLLYAQINLGNFLNMFNINVFLAFNGKNVVFIKVPRWVNYPVINENGMMITVKSHTSENAVYFFLDNALFEQVKKYNFEELRYNRIIRSISLETVVHEIGASYGLPYEVTPDGKIVNDLDRAYAQSIFSGSGHISSGNEILARFPRLKNLAQADLDHVKGRDYAAGAKRDRPANDLGGSSPATLTASQQKTVLLLYAILKNNLPRGPLTLSGFWLKKIEKDNPQELKQLKELDPLLLEWARKFYEGQRSRLTSSDQDAEFYSYYSAAITLLNIVTELDIVTNQTQVEDARAALTFDEHKNLREWLKEHNARQEKYRRRDLEPQYGGIEIYIIPDLPVNGHYAIRDEVVYVSDERYLAHEVYELLSILKYGYANFGDEITLMNFGKRFIAQESGKPNNLPSLLSWFMEKESKEIRLLERRKKAKDKLIEWLDKTGTDLKVLRVLTDIHNNAPKIPGVKAEAMIEYYSNELRLPRLALAILEALENLRDDYILTDTQGLRRAILALKERGLSTQYDFLLDKANPLVIELSKYYSHAATLFLSINSPIIETPQERTYVLKELRKVISAPFDETDRVAVRGAAGDTKAAPQKGAVNPAYVYFFGNGETSAEGLFEKNLDERKIILGGKGESLHSMTRVGIPVPPGFTITTGVCAHYYENNKTYPEEVKIQVGKALERIEKLMDKKFGDPKNPLLVSVRSGARKSMPGMMETVLNVGLTEKTIPGLVALTKNERFVYDAYRRLIMMYSDVVMEKAAGIEPKGGKGIRKLLDEKLEQMKHSKGYRSDTDLTAQDLKTLVADFKKTVEDYLGKPFPDDAAEQLWGAIGAVFASWNGKRAVKYRRIENIPDEWGTAVNVQAMVFGNMGDDCATGVAFSRNPGNGENQFYGEYLPNAQGEDVVAGIRTPAPINDYSKNEQSKNFTTLQKLMPSIYKELDEIKSRLEKHYRDMQDIEFTIENGKLFMLQCRVGKRNGPSAVRMAIDMHNEKLIDADTAIMRVAPNQLVELLLPMIDPKAELTTSPIAKGLPAGPGGAIGRAVFTSEDAVEWAARGEKVILVREETSPEDVDGMRKAQAILTSKGGMTSHAALVARGWGKCCIVGCGEIEIADDEKSFKTKNGATIKEGDLISLNGTKGAVYQGKLPLVDIDIEHNEYYAELMKLVDKARVLKVRANADTPKDAAQALKFGAEGIGLFRTEHMFYGEGSDKPLFLLRKMIMSKSLAERRKALDELFPFVKSDIKATLEEMKGYPATIRLLDPPLHEFVPHSEDKLEALAKELGVDMSELRKRAESLKENNPMLGHRGVRLGITYPEITEMQVRAILEAAAELIKAGKSADPEIMIPVTVSKSELDNQKLIVDKVYKEVLAKFGLKKMHFMYGTMIEIPRAALRSGNMAQTAEFFSFGTNDLTQMGFGFSRDDIGSFLPDYLDAKILPADPFQTIDQDGIGEFIKISIERGRKTRKDLKVGICGEHGGDPESVEFCHKVKMNYVSCSPFRVPIARLAAAQAAIKEKLSKNPVVPAKEAAGQSDIAKSAPAAFNAVEEIKVDSIKATEIFDSRLNPTIKVILSLKSGVVATAAVPSGASTGEREALELRDGQFIKDIEAGKRPDLTPAQIMRLGKILGLDQLGDKIITHDRVYKVLKARLAGKGVLIAVDNVNNIIAPAIKGFDVRQQAEIDRTMIALDGTEYKDKLGANAILAVSMAVARAAARQKGLQLYDYIDERISEMRKNKSKTEFPKATKMPLIIPMLNVINGGEHAGWNLDLQEFMIAPFGFEVDAKRFRDRLPIGINVFNALKKILKDRGEGVSVGDEGGFAPTRFKANTEALEVIVEAIKKAGYAPGKDVSIALDPAASQFYDKKKGKYILKVDGRELTPAEMVDYYSGLVAKYPIHSIEDGMAEDDEAGWKLITEAAKNWENDATKALNAKGILLKKGGQIVGDDLFVTNPKIFKAGIKKGLANSILIKVNQIGTLTETLKTIVMAEEAGYNPVISHRSGETEDDFIGDLVVGVSIESGIGQIKTGASRGERVAKYNRIAAIEEEMLAAAESAAKTPLSASGGEARSLKAHTSPLTIAGGSESSGQITLSEAVRVIDKAAEIIYGPDTAVKILFGIKEYLTILINNRDSSALISRQELLNMGTCDYGQWALEEAQKGIRKALGEKPVVQKVTALAGAQEEGKLEEIREAAAKSAALLEYISRTGREMRVSDEGITINFKDEVPSEEHGLFKGLIKDMMKPNAIGEYIISEISDHKGTYDWAITIPPNSSIEEIEGVFLEAAGVKVQSSKVDTILTSAPAAQTAEEATPAEVQNIKKIDSLFDKKLIAGDTTVIQEIVDYYNVLASSDDRQAFYEWLQHHESALAAEAIAKVGLNWEGVVWKLVNIIDGNIDGNRRAAARQLNELATQSTYGGLKAADKIAADAAIALNQLLETVPSLIQPVAFPETPKVPNGVQPGILVLTRHGETSWSEAVLNKWAGWHDSKITKKGEREAFDSGRHLSKINLRFNVGYTSDLSRAQVTMQKFLEGFRQPDLPISSYWELRERNYGDLIGWRRAIVEKVFGKDQYMKWRRGYEGNDVRPPGGENLRDVKERSIPCFVENALRDIANGKNVAISAHGNSLRSILIDLKERTTGKTLTEEEVMKLEVPLSTPIIITFDQNLHHKELWVKDGIGPKEINEFLTSNRSEISLTEEIAAMTSLASEAGKLLAPPSERYNLLVTWEFFANGELQEHRARYADRFDIDTVSGISFKQFVDNIIAKATGKETKTIVLVPNDLSAGQLERLTKAGIRFIRVDNIGLLQAAMNKDPGREKFQIDTYAAMLLLRRIDGSITADSAIYRLLSFYLKSHFALTERIAIDDYIMAVINNDIAKLIKGYLLYRPAQPYDVPDYNKVAASLISA